MNALTVITVTALAWSHCFAAECDATLGSCEVKEEAMGMVKSSDLRDRSMNMVQKNVRKTLQKNAYNLLTCTFDGTWTNDEQGTVTITLSGNTATGTLNGGELEDTGTVSDDGTKITWGGAFKDGAQAMISTMAPDDDGCKIQDADGQIFSKMETSLSELQKEAHEISGGEENQEDQVEIDQILSKMETSFSELQKEAHEISGGEENQEDQVEIDQEDQEDQEDTRNSQKTKLEHRASGDVSGVTEIAKGLDVTLARKCRGRRCKPAACQFNAYVTRKSKCGWEVGLCKREAVMQFRKLLRQLHAKRTQANIKEYYMKRVKGYQEYRKVLMACLANYYQKLEDARALYKCCGYQRADVPGSRRFIASGKVQRKC